MEKFMLYRRINTVFETLEKVKNEWHYYISSAAFTPEELLHHARMEWSVEVMHWLLDFNTYYKSLTKIDLRGRFIFKY